MTIKVTVELEDGTSRVEVVYVRLGETIIDAAERGARRAGRALTPPSHG